MRHSTDGPRAHVGTVPAADFATELKRRRITARMTQERLAEVAGLSSRCVRDLEVRRVLHPRPESARLIGAALGLAGDELRNFVVLSQCCYWQDRSMEIDGT